MTSDELQRILKDRGVSFNEKPIQNGTRIDCKSGEVFNVFNTGKMSFQGKQDTALANHVRALYEGVPDTQPVTELPVVATARAPAESSIFIVYGHDVDSIHAISLNSSFIGCDSSRLFWVIWPRPATP
jgi:predicted nucleotide-binding protein